MDSKSKKYGKLLQISIGFLSGKRPDFQVEMNELSQAVDSTSLVQELLVDLSVNQFCRNDAEAILMNLVSPSPASNKKTIIQWFSKRDAAHAFANLAWPILLATVFTVFTRKTNQSQAEK